MSSVNYLIKIISLVVFLSSGNATSAIESSKVLPNCLAPKEYLADLDRYKSVIKIEQDYSCLVDLSSIQQKIHNYQLIDIRLSDENLNLDDIWKLPIKELQHKDYLAEKNLLLLGDDFSRVEAANICFNLKNKGFQKTKILVGGFNLWASYKNSQPNNPSIKSIEPHNVIYEYFNGSVILAVSDKNIANKLSRLGFSHHFVVESTNLTQNLSQLIITKTMNGFLPLVYIGDSVVDQTILSNYPNFYQLDGGITALEKQIQNDVITDLSRFDVLEVAACENSKL